MSAVRKKWKITYRGSSDVDLFRSQKSCYEFVQSLARAYAADPRGIARHITVWVDESSGLRWQRFEDHDLAEMAEVTP
jgi:hypothetical protein